MIFFYLLLSVFYHGRKSLRCAACAGAVFNDDGLADFFTQLLRQGPRQNIIGATGRKKHNHPDRFGRVALGQRERRRQTSQNAGSQKLNSDVSCAVHFQVSKTLLCKRLSNNQTTSATTGTAIAVVVSEVNGQPIVFAPRAT